MIEYIQKSKDKNKKQGQGLLSPLLAVSSIMEEESDINVKPDVSRSAMMLN